MSNQSYKRKKSSGFSGKHPVSEEFIEMVAARFRVLGEPMRLKIVRALIGGERSVGDLVTATGATQANISRHLQTLTQAGILRRRKQGLHVYYGIRDETVLDLCEHVCSGVQREVEGKARVFSE